MGPCDKKEVMPELNIAGRILLPVIYIVKHFFESFSQVWISTAFLYPKSLSVQIYPTHLKLEQHGL